MLAILDNRFSEKDADGSSALKLNNVSTDFQPIELIRTSFHLPENFLCDSGYIYETVFKRPPTSVIREALQMLSSKAFEKNALTLNVNQINIAIKQLRLDNLGTQFIDVYFDTAPSLLIFAYSHTGAFSHNLSSGSGDQDSSEAEGAKDDQSGDQQRPDKENVHSNEDGGSSPKATEDLKKSPVAAVAAAVAAQSPAENIFRLQIMIELIRMHVISSNNVRAMASDSPSVGGPTSSGSSSDRLKKPPSGYGLPKWRDGQGDGDSTGSGSMHSSSNDSGDSGDSNSDSEDSLDELFDGLPDFIKAGAPILLDSLIL